jgi:hypothetical protein
MSLIGGFRELYSLLLFHGFPQLSETREANLLFQATSEETIWAFSKVSEARQVFGRISSQLLF